MFHREEPYVTDDLKRFIEGFDNEDALRRAIEALLMKMPGCTNIRATHGALEQGKDIVFCSEGPMGEVLLNACVIKNEKISGSADSDSGARTVFHQVEQSLDTPILNEQGQSQAVSRAYVMTAHECSPQAMESIRGQLVRRSGQVVFICGNDLLVKFKQYLPDFLLANVKFLGAHVKSLRDELDGDPSVARLLVKEGFSTAYGKSLRALFVQPRLAFILRSYDLKMNLPEAKDLERPMREYEAGRLANVLRNFGNLIISLKAKDGDDVDLITQEILSFADELHGAWVSGYNEHRARRDLSERDREKSRADSSVTLGGASELRERSAKLFDRSVLFVEKIRKHVNTSNALSTTKFSDPLSLIRSDKLSDFYLVSDISRRIPSVMIAAHSPNRVQFDKNLLAQTIAPLLITGPAGYGKTSFCRWNALRDLEALEQKSSRVLPVYIQLHRLSAMPLLSFQKAFLASEELAAIWRELTEPDSRNGWTLRLYLDGLDEVPNHARQVEIANIAASGVSPKVQIIMTARDHISGPWLSWLRRLEIQAFDNQEVRQLTEKWLDDDESKVLAFYQKLKQVPSLGSLMRVPLLGTLILAVYKHGYEGLPESRPRLYEMFVRLLAGGWDAAKNINRGSKFKSATKLAVLSHLAGMLHGEKKRDCSTGDVRSALRERVSGLQDRMGEVLSELVVDGLLVPTGSVLSFPHLSFQEFLAAKDLMGLHHDRANQRLNSFLSGDDWWREVLTFYVSFHDKPSEMEEWIKSGVVRALPKTSDEIVRSRGVDLCKVLLTNFPSFKFASDTRQLLGWDSESAFKLGQAKKTSATGPRTVSR
jgi:hypothetical protein